MWLPSSPFCHSTSSSSSVSGSACLFQFEPTPSACRRFISASSVARNSVMSESLKMSIDGQLFAAGNAQSHCKGGGGSQADTQSRPFCALPARSSLTSAGGRRGLYRLELDSCHRKSLSGSSSIRSTLGHSSTCLAESSLELPAASLLEHLLLFSVEQICFGGWGW